MKSETFPLIIKEAGVSASIRKAIQSKGGRTYEAFVVEYYLLGGRKREWRTSLAEAKAAARDACLRISNGEQLVLELKNSDRLTYLRATEALAEIHKPLDSACREYADAIKILGSHSSLLQAVQFFMRQQHNVQTRSVSDAVNELIEQIEAEQENTNNGTRRKVGWLKLLKTNVQNKLARDFNCNVTDLSSATLEPWLVGLKVAERTRRNIRDCVAFFLKWAKGRNYLAKDADPLANVQNFRKRKRGAVKVIWAEDLEKLFSHAPDDFIPYLALRAFAGLRDSEARALDWQYVDLEGGWIDIPDHVAKQADDDEGVARMVKIRPALAAWLRPHIKKSGPMCPYANSVKKLLKVAKAASVTLPKNALRHSFISAAVTLSNDLNAVSVEAGNSPTVIRQHYWRKMRPEQATAWFNVMPKETGEESLAPCIVQRAAA